MSEKVTDCLQAEVKVPASSAASPVPDSGLLLQLGMISV